MKTTHWIKDELFSITTLLNQLDEQIRDRGIGFDDLNNHAYIHKNGKVSDMTINEMLCSLVAKKSILETILK